MDWDGNQEEIRKRLDRAEALTSEMAYEENVETRIGLSMQIIRDIVDVLAKTENMTRWLKGYEEVDGYERRG